MKVSIDVVKFDTCARCGVTIHLVPAGKHFKWVNGWGSWRCGHDPQFPTRAHAPLQINTGVTQ